MASARMPTGGAGPTLNIIAKLAASTQRDNGLS
jgi:hypothetical protein